MVFLPCNLSSKNIVYKADNSLFLKLVNFSLAIESYIQKGFYESISLPENQKLKNMIYNPVASMNCTTAITCQSFVKAN